MCPVGKSLEIEGFCVCCRACHWVLRQIGLALMPTDLNQRIDLFSFEQRFLFNKGQLKITLKELVRLRNSWNPIILNVSTTQ